MHPTSKAFGICVGACISVGVGDNAAFVIRKCTPPNAYLSTPILEGV
jgi:hypothetical protein